MRKTEGEEREERELAGARLEGFPCVLQYPNGVRCDVQFDKCVLDCNESNWKGLGRASIKK